MKKHPLKKFLHETTLSPEVSELLDSSKLGIPLDDQSNLKKIRKDSVAYLTTEDNRMFKAFTLVQNGKFKLIPEPDPILLYFHAAYLSYIQIEPKRREIFEEPVAERMNETMISQLYDYFSVTNNFIIMSFTALEATINRCIPTNYVFKKEIAKRTEIYTKSQIERHMNFDEKIKDILPDATKKSFLKDYPLQYKHLMNLKDFRNMIIHTKEAEGQSTYDYLFKKALKFNYQETLEVIQKFCNYYIDQEFIIECPCSHDW